LFGSLQDRDDEGHTPLDLAKKWNRSAGFVDMLSARLSEINE